MENAEKIKIRGKQYTPEQISAYILQKIKKLLEYHKGGRLLW